MIGLNAITRALGRGFSRRPVMRLIGVTVGVALLWGGCNSEKHYEMLTFFFDGVPDPNASLYLNGVAVSITPTFSQHEPFIREKCMECHVDPSQMELTPRDSSLCLRCHADTLTQFPLMHGAVVGLACLQCHNPHFSELEHLIREKSPALCLQCHADDNNIWASPSHQDPDRDCLSCHLGHGGHDPSFLRETVPGEQNEPEALRSAVADEP